GKGWGRCPMWGRAAGALLRGARRAALRAGVAACAALLLLWASLFLYGTFYYSYVPAVAFVRPVHYAFRTDCGSPGPELCSFPTANVSLLGGNREKVSGGCPIDVGLEVGGMDLWGWRLGGSAMDLCGWRWGGSTMDLWGWRRGVMDLWGWRWGGWIYGAGGGEEPRSVGCSLCPTSPWGWSSPHRVQPLPHSTMGLEVALYGCSLCPTALLGWSSPHRGSASTPHLHGAGARPIGCSLCPTALWGWS
uniref:Seipin n=1 Tax=Amazona collaria TaxID=241587 RepID=A0A8B9FBI0_9PSIT